MKGLRFAALGAAIAFSAATAIAQPPAGTNGQPAQGEHRGMRGGRRGGELGGALFKGVNLTDAQKQQLQQVRQKYGEQRKTLFAQYRPQNGAAQGQRVRPDSATRVQMQSQIRDLMQREIADTRALLTAQQQQTFDQNVATMKQRGAERGEKMRQRRGQRPGA